MHRNTQLLKGKQRMQYTMHIAGKIRRINFRKFRKSSSIFENIFLKRYCLWSCAISYQLNLQKYFFETICDLVLENRAYACTHKHFLISNLNNFADKNWNLTTISRQS